ncbi:MAG TPA: hypothetical protein VGL83_07710 [Stellaceae bacterium]|jgi:hypothetical protein
MASRGIIVVGAASALVVMIAGAMIYTFDQPRRFVFEVELDNMTRLSGPLPETKVLVNGVETPLGHSSEVPEPVITAQGGLAKEYSPDVLPQIEVQYRYACGWKAVQVSLQQPRDDEIKDAQSQGRNIRMQAQLKEDGWVTLFTDNRGQPAHRIELGGIAHDIAKDSGDRASLLQDKRCAEGSAVKLDGRVIGALPSGPAGRSATTSRFLFDPSGKRCYTYRQVGYVAENDLAMMSDNGPEPEVIDLPAGYLHALPDEEVEYFLSPPPDKILVPENQLFPGTPYTQASVLETPCAGKGKAR